MDEQMLDDIGQHAEQIDSVLFGYQNMTALPDRIHLQAMAGKLRETRDWLARLYRANGGTEDLNLDAR